MISLFDLPQMLTILTENLENESNAHVMGPLREIKVRHIYIVTSIDINQSEIKFI